MADATDDTDGVDETKDDDCKEEGRWSRDALMKLKYLVEKSGSSWENIEKQMEEFKWKNAKGKEKEYGIQMLKKKAEEKGWEKKAVPKDSPFKNYIKIEEHERLMKEKDDTIEKLRAQIVPTAKEVYDKCIERKVHRDNPDIEDIDEAVYDVISDWDKFFEGDDKWFDEEGGDLKDQLRDEVLEMLGHET